MSHEYMSHGLSTLEGGCVKAGRNASPHNGKTKVTWYSPSPWACGSFMGRFPVPHCPVRGVCAKSDMSWQGTGLTGCWLALFKTHLSTGGQQSTWPTCLPPATAKEDGKIHQSSPLILSAHMLTGERSL